MGFGSRSLKAQLREANRCGAEYTVILGEEELANGEAQVKVMEGGAQESVALKDLISFLKKEVLGK